MKIPNHYLELAYTNLTVLWISTQLTIIKINIFRVASASRLGSCELSEPAVNLNLEIVRRTSLALVANYLIGI